MKFTTIQICHFRNLTDVTFFPSQCNLFLGENGSGKTSILESIYLLSRGKSFRHHQPKHYIQHQQLTTLVFAKLTDYQQIENKVAIEKSQKAETWLRLNGQSLFTQSALTQILPTLLLEPISLNCLEMGSQTRREILDWLVFHVEQKFFSHWQGYQRLLKQRNIWLKQQKFSLSHHLMQQEIVAWNQQLAMYATLIHDYRQAILDKWQPYFLEQLKIFLPQYHSKIQLRYTAGFDVATDFAEILLQRLSSDIELGYTRLGCHRADLNVVFAWQDEQKHQHHLNATDMLSRGEKKMLMMALRLSQLPLLNLVGKQPIVLLDDITAELDERALMLLLTGLKQVNSQLFITSLSTDILSLIEEIWQDDVKVFHVKQGKVFTIGG